MEQYLEGKELGLHEMATQKGTTVENLTEELYRRQGGWGQRAHQVPRQVEEGVTLSSGRSGPSRAPASGASSFVVVPPPGIYDGDDRKAGTGGGGPDPMVDIAKAIQQQTTELAALVRGQAESSGGPPSTLKGLGRQSEELVFLMRGCGQYQVAVGDQEYGASLANALLAAQSGASTKLRASGFRQKVTPRLAIGLAGPYWGLQDKFCLAVADFLAYTDAELRNGHAAWEGSGGGEAGAADEVRAGPAPNGCVVPCLW